jgi:predicted protein tyrosine phosphatase
VAEFDWVLPRIAVGGAIETADVPQLLRAGITHIADATTRDDTAVVGPSFDVIFGDQPDDGNQDRAGNFYQRLAVWLMYEWFGNSHGRFLFHCDAGVNRGPSAAYLALRLLGLERDQAIRLLTAARPIVANPPRYAPAADAVATLAVATAARAEGAAPPPAGTP